MQKSEAQMDKKRSIGFVAVVYYAVILLALVIGLYGLFSLLWLSTDAIERSANAYPLF